MLQNCAHLQYWISFYNILSVSTAREPPCYDGQVRHYNPVHNSLLTFKGFLEVCYQGEWASICLGDIDTIDTMHLSQLACKTIYGSDGMLGNTFIATDIYRILSTQSCIVELK